jgi:hypothetical protein
VFHQGLMTPAARPPVSPAHNRTDDPSHRTAGQVRRLPVRSDSHTPTLCRGVEPNPPTPRLAPRPRVAVKQPLNENKRNGAAKVAAGGLGARIRR